MLMMNLHMIYNATGTLLLDQVTDGLDVYIDNLKYNEGWLNLCL